VAGVKVLHLFSDWKWTGPAEPTLSLCEALTRAGVDVTIAYRKTPIEFPERTVEKEVARRGLKRFDGFRLNRYFSAKDWLFDIKHVAAYVREKGIDMVHTNLSHDHFTALLSLAFSRQTPLVLRTDHKRDGLDASPFMPWAFRRTDGLVTYSRKIMDGDIKRFSFPEERTCVIPPGITPYRGPVRDVKASLGIVPGESVVGVIGRLKPDRGYDVILKAFKILRERVDRVKLVVVGRSSQIEKSIKQPLVELGIEKDVILAGYRVEDYFDLIAAFDLFVMMRAGSDGSARALREVMAMGKAAIVSDRGMLPELVEDGKSGFVVRNEHELAEKMEALLTDRGKRELFERRARETAETSWTYEAQADKMGRFYDELLSRGKR
jgi:glycosyltransferase involved in cell wall biosynthesis